MYDILIADDHPLFRDAIINVIEANFPGSTLQETENLADTLAQATQHSDLDMILLDLNMPGMNGLNGLIALRNSAPTIPVVIVSAEEEKQTVLQAITYGAVGFITKSQSRDEMASALNQVLSGQVYLPSCVIRAENATNKASPAQKESAVDREKLASLTRRQLLVLERMARGEANKQIAYHLNIAETTVKAHVSAILRKLNVSNRMQAILSAGNVDFNHYLKR